MTSSGPWSALRALPLVTLLVPSALVLAGPLQSNGWPARLLVLWIAAAVALGWLRRPAARRRVSPVEVGCWILILGLLVAFVAVYLRAVSDEEAAGAVRAALVMFPLAVVALGITTLVNAEKADVLLAGIVIGVCFSALVALAQSVSPFDLAGLIRPPGMVARDIGGMGDRAGFLRVKGSAAHPIEFGVLCGAVLPLALHFAQFARRPQVRKLAAAAAGLLVLAVPLSISRSGIVTVFIAMAVYAVVLNTRQRISALVLAVVGMVLFRAAVPGLLGTVLGFFVGAAEDTSVTARTEDYAIVNELFIDDPVVGRGLGTFRPEEYFFLDNQFLMFLVEGGILLVATTLLFFALAVAGARGAVLRATSAADASRAQAVTAGIAAIGLSGFFFDLFSFAQVTVVLFILVGTAGALWHHAQRTGKRLPPPMQRIRSHMGARETVAP